MVEMGSAGVEFLCEHCEGKLEGGLLAGDSGEYVENALEKGIFPYGPRLGNREDWSTGDLRAR
jgi:hypothetical protein